MATPLTIKMAKDMTLFRWEDSHNLNHHCGVCARPLSHPGARVSCFGEHCEPCIRFHQAMFMRNRAHCCMACIAADEAHHKRHAEITELLRRLYDLSGLRLFLRPNWGEALREKSEGNRSRPPESVSEDKSVDGSDFGEDMDDLMGVQSKKERKELKRLVKAATRPKVITQQQIEYVGTVLHPSHATPNEQDGPLNVQEIGEIEKHLRYNAHVYNTKVKRKVILNFGTLSNVEVDFDTEMERILNTLNFTTLVKKNERKIGLQGKELKAFDSMFVTLKQSIVEDLVLVKKDEMEVRMRRAGYFRYTNRASFDIIEERYRERDWKTGERIFRSVDHEIDKLREDEKIEEVDSKENIPPNKESAPDLRHLTNGHTCIHSSRNPKPLRISNLWPLPKQYEELPVQGPAGTLRITPSGTTRASITTKCNDIIPTKAVNIPYVQQLPPSALQMDDHSYTLTADSQKPMDADSAHPPVSQKKIKKAKREAQNRSKSVTHKAETEAADIALVQTHEKQDLSSSPSPAFSSSSPSPAGLPPPSEPTPPPSSLHKDIRLSLISPCVENGDKSTDWTTYTAQLSLDQLTLPFPPHRCVHECPSRHEKPSDCPFHTPAHYYNPMKDTVFLVYHSHTSFALGPYARPRANKLLCLLNMDLRIRGALVQVSEDILEWARGGRAAKPPRRYFLEWQAWMEGASKGPHMRSVDEFDTSFHRNSVSRNQLRREDLEELVKTIEPEDEEVYCCCMSTISHLEHEDVRDLVECAYDRCTYKVFHRDCVTKLNPGADSNFYCADCEELMFSTAGILCEWLEDRQEGRYTCVEDVQEAAVEVREPGHCNEDWEVPVRSAREELKWPGTKKMC